MAPSKNAALSLAKNILSLYEISNYSDETVDNLYDVNAEFSDPLVEVSGINDIKGQFRSLKMILSSSQAKLIRGSLSGGDTLTIESQLDFEFKLLPKFLRASIRIFSICDLDETKVIRHTDHWDVKSLVQNVPIIGFLYNRFRPCFGKVSSAFVNRVMPEGHAHTS